MNAKSELGKKAQKTFSLAQRRAFIQLPIEERCRILAEQAEAMVGHYQERTEWRELMAGDIIE